MGIFGRRRFSYGAGQISTFRGWRLAIVFAECLDGGYDRCDLRSQARSNSRRSHLRTDTKMGARSAITDRLWRLQVNSSSLKAKSMAEWAVITSGGTTGSSRWCISSQAVRYELHAPEVHT